MQITIIKPYSGSSYTIKTCFPSYYYFHDCIDKSRKFLTEDEDKKVFLERIEHYAEGHKLYTTYFYGLRTEPDKTNYTLNKGTNA